MVSGFEEVQIKFMQSLIVEMRVMNDHLKDIKKELETINNLRDVRERVSD